MEPARKERRAFQLPHVIVILVVIMLIVTAMSFIIPSGEFVRDANGLVDPTRFGYIVNDDPIDLFGFFYAIPHGIVESASTIVSIMVISGVLYVIEQTGTIAAGLQKLTVAARGKEIFIILGLTFVFGVLGIIGWGEDALPFVPIFSAWVFRLAIFLVFYGIVSAFLWAYCKRIKRDPGKSVIGTYLEECQQEQEAGAETVPLTGRRIATLLVLLTAFVGQAVGAVQFGWDMEDISGLYVFVAIVVGVINRVSPSKICSDFIQGTTTVMSAVIVIGVARGIFLLMEQAKIVDTIIHTLAAAFEGRSAYAIILLLYVFVIFFNFFVVSASGKAFILFPMLKPLADILGISQQVVVTFQLGDGITNYLFPTCGALMAALELGGVTYQQWMKFAARVLVVLTVVGLGFSFLAQAMGLA